MKSRAPRQRSFFLSFLFFFCLLGLFILIANVTNDGLRDSWDEFFEIDKKVREVVRQNKNQLSLDRFSGELPEEFLVVGIFSSGDGAFYHEFVSLSQRYQKTKRIEFALVNINVFADKTSVAELMAENKMASFDHETLPMVAFFHNGLELKNERLSLEFSNYFKKTCIAKIEQLFRSKSK